MSLILVFLRQPIDKVDKANIHLNYKDNMKTSVIKQLFYTLCEMCLAIFNLVSDNCNGLRVKTSQSRNSVAFPP